MNTAMFPFGIWGQPTDEPNVWLSIDGEKQELPHEEFNTDRVFSTLVSVKIPRSALITGNRSYTLKVDPDIIVPEPFSIERAFVLRMKVEGASPFLLNGPYGVRIQDADDRGIIGKGNEDGFWWLSNFSKEMISPEARACCPNEQEALEFAEAAGGVDNFLKAHGNLSETQLPGHDPMRGLFCPVPVSYFGTVSWGLNTLLAETAWRDGVCLKSPKQRGEFYRNSSQGHFELETEWLERIQSCLLDRMSRVQYLVRKLSRLTLTVADVVHGKHDPYVDSFDSSLHYELLSIRIEFYCGLRPESIN